MYIARQTPKLLEVRFNYGEGLKYVGLIVIAFSLLGILYALRVTQFSCTRETRAMVSCAFESGLATGIPGMDWIPLTTTPIDRLTYAEPGIRRAVDDDGDEYFRYQVVLVTDSGNLLLESGHRRNREAAEMVARERTREIIDFIQDPEQESLSYRAAAHPLTPLFVGVMGLFGVFSFLFAHRTISWIFDLSRRIVIVQKQTLWSNKRTWFWLNDLDEVAGEVVDDTDSDGDPITLFYVRLRRHSRQESSPYEMQKIEHRPQMDLLVDSIQSFLAGQTYPQSRKLQRGFPIGSIILGVIIALIWLLLMQAALFSEPAEVALPVGAALLR